VDYTSKESWERFNEWKSNGEIPNDAKIGGEIGIHGVLSGVKGWVLDGCDWTFGCIAMENDDIDELYPYVEEKETIIHIVP
jgi:hypothetical protein